MKFLVVFLRDIKESLLCRIFDTREEAEEFIRQRPYRDMVQLTMFVISNDPQGIVVKIES